MSMILSYVILVIFGKAAKPGYFIGRERKFIQKLSASLATLNEYLDTVIYTRYSKQPNKHLMCTEINVDSIH